jgi:hypothetical protein
LVGGTDAARAFLEKIKSVPGAQFLGKVLPGVGMHLVYMM